ncbi:MAG: hypothetical protein LBR65_03825 [Culturomica sp.]|nr:hypothetical protein [Culturomica sp.]
MEKIITHEERREGFELFFKLHREGKSLTPEEMVRMEYLIDLAAEADYLTLGRPADDPYKEERKRAIKATYERDLWV